MKSLDLELFDERYAVNQKITTIDTELDGLGFPASPNGTDIMSVNADDAVTDCRSMKQILFLYKRPSDDG